MMTVVFIKDACLVKIKLSLKHNFSVNIGIKITTKAERKQKQNKTKQKQLFYGLKGNICMFINHCSNYQRY